MGLWAIGLEGGILGELRGSRTYRRMNEINGGTRVDPFLLFLVGFRIGSIGL